MKRDLDASATRALVTVVPFVAALVLTLSSCGAPPTAVGAEPTGSRPSPSTVGNSATQEAQQVVPANPVDERDTSEFPQAYILGDSLTYKARKYLPAALAEQGWRSNPADESRIGRMVAEGLDVLRAEVDLPDTVLIALGTNNWLATAANAASWITEARSIIGPDRRLIWVNLHMKGERYVNFTAVNRGLTSGARADNRSLRTQGARGRTYIADWYSFAITRQIPHSKDGVHYKQGASRQRMAFYAGVIAEDPVYARYLSK